MPKRRNASILLAALFLQAAISAALADDAYITAEGNKWTLGTATVERVIVFEDGKLFSKSLKDKITGRELLSGGAADEFFVTPGDARQPLGSCTGTWKLVRANQARLKEGEMQLDLALQQGSLLAAKSYVVYPGSSIIREWVTFTNAGKEPLRLVEPGFFSLTARPGAAAALDFHWMTGGANEPGSWLLKTEKLRPARPRVFDSYDPFSASGSQSPGDGINAKITLNGKQVWPAQGWQYVANATVAAPFEFTAEVAAGDKLAFLVNMNANIGYDTTAFDPTITYDDGEKHVASQEFGPKQGGDGWQYQYVEGGRFVDLTYYPRINSGGRRRITSRARPLSAWTTSIPTPGRMPRGSGPRPRRDACGSAARFATRATSLAGVSAWAPRPTHLGTLSWTAIPAKGWSSDGIISAIGPPRSNNLPRAR